MIVLFPLSLPEEPNENVNENVRFRKHFSENFRKNLEFSQKIHFPIIDMSWLSCPGYL
jgi:predicted RNA methylase